MRCQRMVWRIGTEVVNDIYVVNISLAVGGESALGTPSAGDLYHYYPRPVQAS